MFKLTAARPRVGFAAVRGRRCTLRTSLVAGLVLCALAPAASAVAATPGVPEPPGDVFTEDFETRADPASPELLSAYVGGAPEFMTYTADPFWISGPDCNGIVASFNSTTGDAGCTVNNVYNVYIRPLARALGNLGGGDANDALSASTTGQTGAPAADAIQLETASPVALPSAGRFITFSVDVAADSCNAPDDPLLKFYLVDGATEIPTFATPINPCTDPAVGGTGIGTSDPRYGRYAGNSAVLFGGASLGLRLRNGQSGDSGNDYAIDNVSVLDATPRLDQSFSGPVPSGGSSTLTFTVTNTTDLAAKPGWSFTDTLPAGLTIAATPNVTSTCTPSTIGATAGGTTVGATGTLGAGQASCTITVDVVAAAPGVYSSGPANVSPHVGVDPTPANASVTFSPPVVGTYPDEVAADGPSYWWRLGEPSGSVMQPNTGGKPGTYKNNVVLGQPGAPGAAPNTAAAFNGTASYAYVNGIPAPKTAYTLEILMKAGAAVQSGTLLEQGGAGSLYINPDRFCFRQVATTVCWMHAPTAGVWYHVAGTWDAVSKVARLYVNGVERASASAPGIPSGSATLYVGYGQFAPWFKGVLDEPAYYSTALSASRIATHYAACAC
jgi:uncharacterized repeat protein (TIGR01451 family)